MADNKQAGAAVGSGPTFATDEIAGIDYPRAKVVWGVDGVATDASASNPLPVVQTGTPALPTGAATAAKQPALGTAGSSSADVLSVQGIASGTAMPISGTVTANAGTGTMAVSAASLPLPSGAATSAAQTTAQTTLDAIKTAAEILDNAIAGNEMQVDVLTMPTVTVNAHAVTNAGTFATQIDGAALTALQLIDNLVLAEDAAASGGEPGVAVLAVRRDAASSGVGADGDFANLSVDSTGALRVTGGGGGTQYAEDAAHTTGDTGTMVLGVRRDANTTLVGADGDYAPFQLDASGSVKVAITAGAGSGGTSIADDAAFTPASTSITPVGGTYRSTLDAVDDGDAGAFAMTANRALHVNLRTAAGVELTAGDQYAEDAAHASGDSLMMAGAVRRDTAAVGSGTDGDNSTLNVNSVGRLWTTTVIDTALPAGTNAIGKLAANSGVDIGDVDIASIAAGDNNIGNVDIVTMPNVTLAAGTNTNEIVGDAAHDAAIAGNPVRVAGRGMSADYTAVATGDTADLLATLLGKLVTVPYALPANTWNYAAPAGGLVSQTAVTVKAAAAAGVRNYVTSIQVINSHATISTELMLLDGAAGTVLWRGWAQAAGGGISCKFDPPLRGSAATLLEIDEVTATGTAGVLVNVQGFVAAE
jgi:hypothetical protein